MIVWSIDFSDDIFQLVSTRHLFQGLLEGELIGLDILAMSPPLLLFIIIV